MTPRCNLHTHTRYGDGANTPEEMIIAALERGLDTLGFSEHSPLGGDGNEKEWFMSSRELSEYIGEISYLKEKYSERINILLGIEQDSLSAPSTYRFDYVIGSVHAVVKDGLRIDVDADVQLVKKCINELYDGDIKGYIRDYYSAVAGVVEATNCDIIAHFDLITKFNEKYPFIDTASELYRNEALSALDALVEKDKIFEINTGAISRGWRTSPYPEPFLLKRLAEKKANVMISSDTHSKNTVSFFFEEAVCYAKACGITELCVYDGKNIKKLAI